MRLSRYNALSVHIYSDATTPIYDVDDELANIENIRFSTGYPGGLFLNASMFWPRSVTASALIGNNRRMVIRNGQETVFEGLITELGSELSDQEGVQIEAVGYWGALLRQRRWRKRWCDKRITDSVWRYLETASGANKCTLDRHNRIRFIPKGVAWLNTNGAAVRYTMPTGETVKRITFNYDLQEAAQAWKLELDDGSTVLWSVNASGTGSVDHTLVTPSQVVQLVLRAEANQTPVEDGTIYGNFSNITVYSETGSINLTEVAKDIRGRLTDLSSNENYIASNAFALEPFIADRFETAAEILNLAAQYGDSSFNAWACGVREAALVTDSKPVLFVEQQPALTDYDYAVRLEDTNVQPGLVFPRDLSAEALVNWVIVEYTDELGRTIYLSPDDDANLKDTTSISKYGQSDGLVRLGSASSAVATNIGRRYLASHKDPQWRLDRPLSVMGYVRAKNGNPIPSSQIRAGKRIKFENFLNDLSGTGLTFLITRTDYNDENETCSIQTGKPDDLAAYLAQQKLIDDRLLA